MSSSSSAKRTALDQYMHDTSHHARMFDYIDMKKQVKKVKDITILQRMLLGQFLECFPIDDRGFSINNSIINTIYDIEHTTQTDHIYWIGGSFSWNHLLCYNTTFSKYDKLATMIGHLEVNYIHKNFDDNRIKVIDYYNVLYDLQSKLSVHGIKTKIIPEYFDVERSDGTKDGNRPEIATIKTTEKTDDYGNIFTFYEFNSMGLFKPPLCRMKLVIDNSDAMQSGGATKPKSRKSSIGKCKMIFNLIEQLTLCSQFNQEQINKIRTSTYDNVTIVDFTFEVITQGSFDSKKDTSILNVDEFFATFTDAYIEKQNSAVDVENKNIVHIRSKINRLNDLGMLTQSYLITSDKKTNMGLNIDRYRQELFFLEKFYGGIKKPTNEEREIIYSRIVEYFNKQVLYRYKHLFGNLRAHNDYFVEKMEHIAHKHISVYFEEFVDFIDKWIVSRFRAPINTFIVDINKVLKARYGVILFVAGGDAMRRYENDISFTKDIDTKLYIGNIKLDTITDDVTRKLSSSWSDLSYTEKRRLIKIDIINIISEYIVNLRIHLEENIENILVKQTKIVSEDGIITHREDALDKIVHISRLHNGRSIKYVVKTIIDNSGRYRFRTREIRKTKEFPVDLYSIDMQTQLIIDDKVYNHDISLLDVVLQDTDDFHDTYYKIARDDDGKDIPVASLEFLLEDFYTTYIQKHDRALARVSSGKVKKDIERYKELFKIYNVYLLNLLENQENAKKYFEDFADKIPEYFAPLFRKLKGGNIPKRLTKGGMHEIKQIVSVKKELVDQIIDNVPEYLKKYFNELPPYNADRLMIEHEPQVYDDNIINEILQQFSDDNDKDTFHGILNKIKNKDPFTIEDYIKITELLRDHNMNHNNKLVKFLSDLAFFKKSLYNEKLNIIDDSSYKWYIPSQYAMHYDSAYIKPEFNFEYDNYLRLFKALVSSKNTNQKNKIAFYKPQITKALIQYGIINKARGQSAISANAKAKRDAKKEDDARRILEEAKKNEEIKALMKARKEAKKQAEADAIRRKTLDEEKRKRAQSERREQSAKRRGLDNIDYNSYKKIKNDD